MRVTTGCPDIQQYRGLINGKLSPTEADTLLAHLEGCAACARQVAAIADQDSLANLVREAGSRADAVSSERLSLLVQRLRKQQPTAQPRPADATLPPKDIQPGRTFSLRCPGCKKSLKISAAMAGKKVKCPHCQAAVRVSAPTTSLPPGAVPPVPVPGLAEAKTLAGESPATMGGGTVDQEENKDRELLDFLAPAQAPDELGRLGTYRILAILGAGGMGVVYKAEDPSLKRLVALKAMLPGLGASVAARKRFLREAQSAAAVKHDHIVSIYQVGEERGVPYLAMEFLKGEPLDQRLEREGKLPLAEVLRIGREIAEGLEAAHEGGLIHRDIKPANVWLETRSSPLSTRGRGVGGEVSRVKILDFGLARAASEEAHLTQSGAIVGTPAYMAPEQAQNKGVDHRCDIFSLGVVLYRMCTGEMPWKGTDTISTLMAVAMEEPRPPSSVNADVPQELTDLIMKLLDKDPSRRLASAGEVAQALRGLEQQPQQQRESKAEKTAFAIATGAQPRQRRDPKKRVAAAPSRRSRHLLIAAGVLLGVLLGGGFLALILFRGPDGDYAIETDDPSFTFQVAKNGSVTLEDRKTNRKYHMKVLSQKKNGEFDLEVADQGNDLAFVTTVFKIKRGEKVALKAWFTRKQDKEALGRVVDEWAQKVAAMPAEKQVKAVMDKLKDLNPDFDGKETHVVGSGGVVTDLQFSTEKVSDISPMRALVGLQTLNCSGSEENGRFANLAPLKDLKLTSLDCSRTKVSDLSPLKGMKLTMLNCVATRVSDLSPLKDMKLTELHCGHSKVSDLSPLKDMKLTALWCSDMPVSDLSPLKGMPIAYLEFQATLVADLSPLQGMPLKTLFCANTPVSDLTPLKNMKFTRVDCHHTQVSDLSPLKGMPLDELSCGATKVTDLTPLKEVSIRILACDFTAERDAKLLGSIKTLEFINGKPAKEILGATSTPVDDAWLQQVAAMPTEKQVKAVMARLKDLNPGFDKEETHVCGKAGVVTELQFASDKVTDIAPLRAFAGLQTLIVNGTPGGKGQLADLSPLKDMRLTTLNCYRTKVSDLSPLKDMKLTTLDCGETYVADLSPVKDMKLTNIGCGYSRVTELSPLRGMPLEVLACDHTNVKDLSPLKGMKLTRLLIAFTAVAELAPLQGMKLTYLDCNGTKVSDLSPLAGMPLEALMCRETKIANLSPIKDMPLKHVTCDFVPERDAKILRSIKNLETINGKPARDLLKGAADK